MGSGGLSSVARACYMAVISQMGALITLHLLVQLVAAPPPPPPPLFPFLALGMADKC